MANGLFDNVYNPDVLSCLANLSNDEVFTPPDIVNQMLDMLPQELFRNPDTTFLERYISEDLWEKLLSTYRMDSYENIWEALFLCHQLFRAVSGEVAERLHYAYPEYDRNITKYTRDMYKKYTGKTGCLDSTYAADIEERREQ